MHFRSTDPKHPSDVMEIKKRQHTLTDGKIFM